VLINAKISHEIDASVLGGHIFSVASHDEPSVKALAMAHGIPIYQSGPSKFVGNVSNIHIPEAQAPVEEFVEPVQPAEIYMKKMLKVGNQMGSNKGGVYAASNLSGEQKYYVKAPPSLDHVQNELLAAKLYQLAGAKTMTYVPVKGGEHVATLLQPLDKNNVNQLDDTQRTAAQSDFAIHAWLANWDAAGTGGDNQVVVKGEHWPTTVDVGGSLKYRAQGEPKGVAFGDQVSEINTLRDPSSNPDAAKLFGDMTNEQIVASIERVTKIPNNKIYETVYDAGAPASL